MEFAEFLKSQGDDRNKDEDTSERIEKKRQASAQRPAFIAAAVKVYSEIDPQTKEKIPLSDALGIDYARGCELAVIANVCIAIGGNRGDALRIADKFPGLGRLELLFIAGAIVNE